MTSIFHLDLSRIFKLPFLGSQGSICPQLKFFVSLRIYETPTPATEILNEYSNRYVDDPIIELSRQAKQGAKHGRGLHQHQPKGKRIVKAKNRQIADFIDPLGENFASHTISSALKADYGQYDVRAKLEQLNDEIKRTRLIKNKPEYDDDSTPFVVRRVSATKNDHSNDVVAMIPISLFVLLSRYKIRS